MIYICIVCMYVFVFRRRLLAADMMTCRDQEGEMGKPARLQWPVARPLPLQGPIQTPSWCQSAGNDHNHHRWQTFHAVHISQGTKEDNFISFSWAALNNVF